MRSGSKVVEAKTGRKFAELFTVAALSIALMGNGCVGQVGNTATISSTLSSTIASSITAQTNAVPGTKPTTISSTATSLLYEGIINPAQYGEPPNEIWVDGYGCYPNILTVKTGTVVTWVDFDIIPFMVTSDDHGLFEGWYGPSPSYGTPSHVTFSVLFSYPGTFGWSNAPYEFTGKIIVVA